MDKAIPQYELGHLDKVRMIEDLSGKNFKVLGSHMYGVSLIDIIAKSRDLVRKSLD